MMRSFAFDPALCVCVLCVLCVVCVCVCVRARAFLCAFFFVCVSLPVGRDYVSRAFARDTCQLEPNDSCIEYMDTRPVSVGLISRSDQPF